MSLSVVETGERVLIKLSLSRLSQSILSYLVSGLVCACLSVSMCGFSMITVTGSEKKLTSVAETNRQFDALPQIRTMYSRLVLFVSSSA